MLPAEARLRHRDDFAATIRHGRRVVRGPLVFHVAKPNVRSVSTRIGFVISAKVGSAVRRNLLRRRLRELLRVRLGLLPAGSAVVIRATPGAAELDFGALARLVDSAVADLQPC